MDANSNGKASKSGEISMTEEENKKASPADAGGAEVVILISGEVSKARNSVDSAAAPMSCCPSPEIARFSPSPKRAQTPTQRKSFTRSVLSEPKSRSGEQSVPGTPSLGGEDEDEEIYKKVSIQRKLKYKRVKMKVLIEWIFFFCILGIFVASLTVHKLPHYMILGLEVWKWSLLVLVTFSGVLVTKWSIRFVVFLIERNFLFRKNVLYVVHGLKKSVQVCLWLGLVLLTWVLLFDRGMDQSPKTTRILDRVTRTIVSLFIGSFLWLLKTLLITILTSSFHRFFDRIQESVFHQYILQTLSGPPVMELEQMIGRESSNSHLSSRFKKKKKAGKEKEVIDVHKLLRMKQEVSARHMKMLVDAISSSGLSTISNSLDEDFYDGRDEQMDKEITNEMEAIAAAYHIFRNVAHTDCKYIKEEDLSRFLIKEEVDLLFPQFEGSETGQIDKKSFTNWVVKVYNGRKTLSHSLNDTKTAVKHLNKLLTGSLLLVMVIVWLILVEIAATQVLVFVSSQLVVAAFMFGKAIIFVFVTHPFDVGDRCVIDGVQMIVEEMNILSTVFLRYDKEMIYYPNSVLATKPISNFYRSPDMGDSLEFSVDFKTPVEKIEALKDKIKNYLECNSQYWHPKHTVVVKEIDNVNNIKMVLFFNHTMNFQEYIEKLRRRSELVMEMKKFFDELGIKYNSILPQEVRLGESTMTTVAAGTNNDN